MFHVTFTLRQTFLAVAIVIGLLVHSFGLIASVQAAPRTTIRYVATTGSDSGTCTNPAIPCHTIQYAVNQSTTGDTIKVAAGTYTYSAANDICTFMLTRAVVCFVDKQLTILGGYTTSNWTAANPVGNPTYIDGQNTYRGVAVIGYNTLTTNLRMEGFIIHNGRATGPTYPGDWSGIGGGMWVQKATVNLADMIFRNNVALGADNHAGAGGAAAGSALRIEHSPAGTSSVLQRVTFDSNRSYGGTGTTRGGVAFGALFVYGSTIRIEDSIFTNNLAQAGSSSGSGLDGGLYADALGGGIGLESSAATINRITAVGNRVIGGNAGTEAGGGFGGAVFSENGTSLSIADSYLFNNSVYGGNGWKGGFAGGGGILSHNDLSTSIFRTQVLSNTVISGTGTGYAGAAGGGGIYLWVNQAGRSGSASLVNVITADNYVASGGGNPAAGGGGGGIQVQGLSANISHATIARNRLGSTLVSGQGLVVLASPDVSSGSVNLNHSIIADHTEGRAGAVAVLVQQGNTLTFNQGVFSNNTKNTNADGSPVPPGTINGLSTMQSVPSVGFIAPGSPYYNYHLRYDSAVKDQAIGSATVDDIDRQGRPCNQVSDFGADEYCPFALSVTSGNSTLHLDWTDGAYALSGGVAYYDVFVTCASGANPPAQGNCGQAINVGAVTTFDLTGLSNLKEYTVTVRAYDASGVLLANSVTITAIPIDTPYSLYLPLILK